MSRETAWRLRENRTGQRGKNWLWLRHLNPKTILKAKFNSRIIFNEKNKAWEEVVAAVNAVNGESNREEMEVRKEWDNYLCVWGKKMMSDWRKASKKTGNCHF